MIIQDKWKLKDVPENYKCSSSKFYLTGEDDFKILNHRKILIFLVIYCY